MPIAFLKPTSQTDAGPNIATGALTDVDEGVSGADGNLEVSIGKVWLTPFFVEWALEDLPGDADSINSVILRVRARIVGTWVDDSIQYAWTIQGTNVAHPLLEWDFQADGGAGLANRQQTVTDSPTVANINAALIRVTQTYSSSMAKEAITHDWDCFELEVDYNTAAVGAISATVPMAFAKSAADLEGKGKLDATVALVIGAPTVDLEGKGKLDATVALAFAKSAADLKGKGKLDATVPMAFSKVLANLVDATPPLAGPATGRHIGPFILEFVS